MIDFADKVVSYIESHRLLPDDERVLVGVSGGIDSMTLLHVLRHIGFAVTAVHVNYGRRGIESDGDEQLVLAFCTENDIPCHIRHYDGQGHRGDSFQAVARNYRYRVYQEIAEAEGIRYVAVGHNRDDQAETLLLNLFRGSGMEGMCAMRSRRRLSPGSDIRLIRPLLTVTRTEIEAWAAHHGIPWREDRSNQSLQYRRNLVRQVLLPEIRKRFGDGAVEGIVRTAFQIQSYQDLVLGKHLRSAFERCRVPNSPELSLVRLAALPPIVRTHVLLTASRT